MFGNGTVDKSKDQLYVYLILNFIKEQRVPARMILELTWPIIIIERCLLMKSFVLINAILVMMLTVAPLVMLPFTKYQIRQRVSCARYLCV